MPAALWAMTPRAFLALFAKNPHDRGSGFDRVKAVQDANDERGRRGLKPVVPSWL